MDRFWVSTRKGLFRVERIQGRWQIKHVAFLGDSVSIALPDARDGALYAGLGLGHFGVKLRRSRDLGETWEELPAPAFPPHPEGGTDTLPDGRPWPWRVEQLWALEAGLANEPGRLWCGTVGGGLFRSDDSGASWSLSEALWNHPGRRAWFGGGADLPAIHSICVHPKDGKRVLVGVSCGGVWQSADAGASWELTADGMFAAYMPPEQRGEPGIQDPHRIVACPSAPERLWAQHHNGVFRSDDGGRNWKSIDNVLPSVFGFAVAVHPHDPDSAWLVPAVADAERVPVAANVVVARTRDAGRTWQVLTDGLPQGHAYDLTFRHALDIDGSGQRLAFGSSTGSLWVSENGGDKWLELSAHLPPIYAVRFDATA